MILTIFFFFLSLFGFFDLLFLFWGFSIIFFFVFMFYGGLSDGVFFSDYISLILVFLTLWVLLFSILSTSSCGPINFFIFSFMGCLLVFRFLTVRFLFFFVSFELVFFIMFIFLLGWGVNTERIQASFFMFFYTIVFSLPLLALLIYMHSVFYSFEVLYFFSGEGFFGFLAFLVFLVKLPVFGFHGWLPKAHVEAPLGGSIILAGILLKLGGYGLFRFFPLMLDYRLSRRLFFNYLFFLRILGGLFISWICVCQVDLKKIIAYSSVVHIRVMIAGLFSFSDWGVLGSFFMLFSHGLVSPLLFFLLGFLYSFKNSRRVLVLKGVLLSCPLFCIFWFFSCFLNLGLPPFISFFREILICGGLGSFSPLVWGFFGVLCFFSGVYCVFLYILPTYGCSVYSFNIFINCKILFLSFSPLFCCFIPLFILFYLTI